MSIGLKDKESWESSGTVGSLKVERRPSFWRCGIACDESSAIDKVLASDGKVDPVDCDDKSYAGIEACQLGRVCLSQSR